MNAQLEWRDSIVQYLVDILVMGKDVKAYVTVQKTAVMLQLAAKVFYCYIIKSV